MHRETCLTVLIDGVRTLRPIIIHTTIFQIIGRNVVKPYRHKIECAN